MERGAWQRFATVGIVASLAVALVALGLGIAALNKTSPVQTNGGPVTTVLAPISNSTVSGTVGLVAKPVAQGVVAIDFLATGGTLHDAKIATALPSYIGWAAGWNTRKVANGTYDLVSVGYDAQGAMGRSSIVVVIVSN